MIQLFYLFLFILCFGIMQSIIYRMHGTTPEKEARKQLEAIKNSDVVMRFLLEKQITLKRMGAGVLLKDQMSVGQWYLSKLLFAFSFGLCSFFMLQGLGIHSFKKGILLVSFVLGWFFLDVLLKAKNKASNDEMMPDIMEMSRSVLYGKRGGQYIADALKDAVIVVENKRLKSALLKLRTDLDAGKSLEECLSDLELSFSNAEISSFCTVIKSLQVTGQVDEALKTLEQNIEREQISVNKRRCLRLEQKTMLYVILIAMDILAMILYCIIMKLMELQIGF
mgnify:FL=1